jgi:hypothetical protein
MGDPFHDQADFELAPLPERVVVLLSSVAAPARLVAHLRLVHDVATRLLDAISRTWPTIHLDREAFLFGAATHDIGKAVHRNELHESGALHEVDGRRLLIERGIDDHLARFAETHAAWKKGGDCNLEDLLVALADTCWKGKRSDVLEDLVCSALLRQIVAERWEVFTTLDSIIAALATDADQRLAWQSTY